MGSLTDDQKQACLRAAEYISQHGHAKGEYFADDKTIPESHILMNDDRNPPACMLGAIAKVTGTSSEDVRLEYSGVLGEMLGPIRSDLTGTLFKVRPVQRFNDLPETSAEDVILKLKEFGTS